MTDLSPISREHQPTFSATDTFVLSPTGKTLRFGAIEKKFLMALDQNHDLRKAAEDIGKTEQWALAFFKRPHVNEWMTKIAQEQSAKSGMTVNWIRGQLLAVIRGKETYWEGTCAVCRVKQRTWLMPEEVEGVFYERCLACPQTVLMQEVNVPVKLDRQQMVALQELAARVDPKVERVSHEFSEETFQFKERED